MLYEVKVNYQRQTGEDNPSSVKEVYLVDAVTPADAQNRVTEEISPMIFGDVEFPSIKRRRFYDCIDGQDDIWFKGSVELIVMTDSGSEQRNKVAVLVNAPDIKTALQKLTKHLEEIDNEIVSVEKTQILEYFKFVDENPEDVK